MELFCHKKGSESHLFLDGREFRRLEVVVSRGHVGVAATHDRKKGKEMSPQNPPSSRSSRCWWLHGTNGLSTIQTWNRELSVEQLQRWPKVQKSPRDHDGFADEEPEFISALGADFCCVYTLASTVTRVSSECCGQRSTSVSM